MQRRAGNSRFWTLAREAGSSSWSSPTVPVPVTPVALALYSSTAGNPSLCETAARVPSPATVRTYATVRHRCCRSRIGRRGCPYLAPPTKGCQDTKVDSYLSNKGDWQKVVWTHHRDGAVASDRLDPALPIVTSWVRGKYPRIHHAVPTPRQHLAPSCLCSLKAAFAALAAGLLLSSRRGGATKPPFWTCRVRGRRHAPFLARVRARRRHAPHRRHRD